MSQFSALTNPLNNFVKLNMSHFIGRETDLLFDLPRVIQLVCSRAGIQRSLPGSKAFLFSSPYVSYTVPITRALSVSITVSFYVALKYLETSFYRILLFSESSRSYPLLQL